MPSKIPSCRHALPQQSVKNPAKLRRTRRITRPFTPLPKTYLLQIPRTLHAALVFLWEYSGGRPCTVPYRLLAAKLGVHVRTAQAHVYRLERLGELGVCRRRVSHRRNATNLYTFPKLQGFIVEVEYGEITVEKPIQILKANTPPAARVENHPPAMRKLYERVRHLTETIRRISDAKQYRLHKAQERNRMALKASIGVNTAPIVPMTQAERQELDRERRRYEAEALAKAAEASAQRERAAEARRIELEWLEAHREGCEDCRGTGRLVYFPGGVLTYRECKHGGMMRA